MCGRYGTSYEAGALKNLSILYLAASPTTIEADLERSTVSTQVRPTNRSVVFFTHDDQVETAAGYWTLVPKWFEKNIRWAVSKTGKPALRIEGGGRVHFNSRRDTLTSSPGWRRYLQHNRCLVFLSCYYEWSDDEMLGKGVKQAGRFAVRGQEAFPVAGIYSWITDQENRPLLTFSVITTEPNEMMKALPHHRMPAILDQSTAKAWLAKDTPEPEALLTPLPDSQMDGEVVPATEFAALVGG